MQQISNTAQLIGIHLQRNRCGYIYFHSQGLKLTVGAGAVFTQQPPCGNVSKHHLIIANLQMALQGTVPLSHQLLH